MPLGRLVPALLGILVALGGLLGVLLGIASISRDSRLAGGRDAVLGCSSWDLSGHAGIGSGAHIEGPGSIPSLLLLGTPGGILLGLGGVLLVVVRLLAVLLALAKVLVGRCRHGDKRVRRKPWRNPARGFESKSSGPTTGKGGAKSKEHTDEKAVGAG